MLTRLPLTLLAAMFACGLFSMPAHAQRARVFVASYGSDSNPCTFLSPCRNFQQAVNVVAAGGEVTAIDSAGFGPININQAVTITSPNGIEAGIAAAPAGNAITISVGPSDVVTLRGLTLNGANSGANGVVFNGGGKIAIIDCKITNYTQYGVLVETQPGVVFNVPTTTVLISNTYVAENGGGIVLTNQAGRGNIIANLNHVTTDNNQDSVEVIAVNDTIKATISDSEIGVNQEIGIYSSGSGVSSQAIVKLINVNVLDAPHGLYLTGYAYDLLSHVWLSGSTSNQEVFTCVNTKLGVVGDIISDGTNSLIGVNNTCKIGPDVTF